MALAGLIGRCLNAGLAGSNRLESATASISSRVRFGLAVAVGAQQLKVLDPIVEAIAVDVVESHRERFAQPLEDPTALTAVLFDTETKKSLFQVPPVSW